MMSFAKWRNDVAEVEARQKAVLAKWSRAEARSNAEYSKRTGIYVLEGGRWCAEDHPQNG
jgi:hypothetical protein